MPVDVWLIECTQRVGLCLIQMKFLIRMSTSVFITL